MPDAMHDHQHDTGHDTGHDALREWSAYLDVVESAARAVERQVLDPAGVGAGPLAAALPGALPRPASAWPPALEGRRREVLDVLASVTSTVEQRRDGTAGALAALGRPQPATPAGYGDGGTLDVLG